MRPEETLDSLREGGRQRLYPRLTNPNWLILRRRREIFRRWMDQLQLQSPTVLDVGGRIQPYRELIATPHRYCSIDLKPTALVGAVANAEHLPFAHNSFDVVLCTQMIEYACDPPALVQEIHRVLRPDGVLLLSAPSIFPRDSEHDRWRFFPAALKQMLGGFSEVEVAPECGSAAGFLRTAAVFVHMSARFEVLRFLLRCSLIPMLNCAGALIEKTFGVRDGSFTVNYSVFAKK